MSVRLARLLALGWVALVTIYFLIEAATYTGLYRWLAELQLWWWFFYLPMLSIFVLVAIFSLPALIVLAVLYRRGRRDLSDEARARAGLRFSERFGRGLFAAAGLFAVAAAGLLIHAYAGLPSAKGYVRLHSVGTASRDLPTEGPTQLIGVAPARVGVYGTYWMVGYRHIGFAPAASSPALRSVRFFVEVPPGRDGLYPRTTAATAWTGILVEGGLPGAMQRLFRANGYVIPARHYTLYQSEASMRIVYLVRTAQFALVAAMLLGFATWQRRNVNRLRDALGQV